MNLTELQVQLRSIEEHISDLQVEIEKMKPQPEDEKKAMFVDITKVAKQFPLKEREFDKSFDTMKKDYIACLSYIMLVDNTNLHHKLLYLCRLSYGIGLSASAEDIYQMGMEVDKERFERIYLEIREFKYAFFVDAFILANIAGASSSAIYTLIADMAVVMECNKEDLKTTAYMAKAVLTEKFDILESLPAPKDENCGKQLAQYVPDSWLESKRVYCGKVVEVVEGHKWAITEQRIRSGSFVKKEDILMIQKRGAETDKYIEAACDGIVVYFRKKFNPMYDEIFAYVVSYFDSHEKFLKWYSEKESK